ncbi:MAG: hypothetical protein U1E73_14180 [Planctomycetota bacterium]
MPYRRRHDQPGEWFHVTNRAIARRTLFENDHDIARFGEGIAKATEQGLIEVHAYSLVTTHFHALVRSPAGELSRALRDIQLSYVRHFNRSRRRDGPLMRGRFRSLFVDTLAYRHILVGYIDANAPEAGLARRADEYPHCSCRAYVHGGGPPWLVRSWVEEATKGVFARSVFRPRDYVDLFHRRFTKGHCDLVDQRIARTAGRSRGDTSLLRDLGARAQDWVLRKARLADGTRPGSPMVGAAHVIQPGNPPATTLLERETRAFLLRHLAGLKFVEIGGLLQLSPEGARQCFARASALIRDDHGFAERVSQRCAEAVDAARSMLTAE